MSDADPEQGDAPGVVPRSKRYRTQELSRTPDWLQSLSIFSLVVAFVCFAIIAWDERGDPQHMWIMNVVWPVAALFGSIVWLWAYFTYGKLATRRQTLEAKSWGNDPPNKRRTPFPMMVFKGTSHCGSGCTLGTLIFAA